MEVVWITPKWPFPVADGARIATTQLLQNLTLQGMNIHLCSIIPEGDEPLINEAFTELGVQSVSLIRRPKSSRLSQLLSLFRRPLVPITLAAYASTSVRKAIQAELECRHPDVLIYDGLHAAAWRLSEPKKSKPSFKEVYRAHNVESEIWFRAVKQTKNILKKLLLFYQGALVKRVESRLVAEAEYTFPVSISDEAIFLAYPEHGQLFTVPIGIRVLSSQGPSVSIISTTRKVLFVGKLDWPPNREGLQWVLDKAWPKISELHPDLELTVVGSGDRSWLDQYQNLQGLRIVGQVESLASYYQNCIATLVPVFYGSGTRVKAIESSLYGRMCISTQIGVEGMGLKAGETYCRAETAAEWIDAIGNLETKAAMLMGQKAKLYAESIFDPIVIARKFKQTLSPLEGSSLSH